MTADKSSQLLGHGKSDQKVLAAKAAVHLPVEPLPGFLVLAVGTMPIAAAAVHMVVFAAGAALVNRQAIVTAAAVDDGRDGFLVDIGHLVAKAALVLWAEAFKDLFNGCHGRHLSSVHR
jgi:hypothetical protein